jgi:hypothetical protein
MTQGRKKVSRVVAGLGLPALLAACIVTADDTSVLTCDEAADRGFPCEPSAGRAGAGAGGVSGAAGAPLMGTGGSSEGGLGGGGSGGSGPCTSDAACGAEKGAGSLCVGDACTEATATCTRATLVVVAEGFAGDVDALLSGACFHRQLDPALAAIVAGTTTKVVAYAASTIVAAPLTVPEGVTLEGRTTDTKAPVALTVTTPIAGAPLVVLGSGGGLKGFALDGKTTAGGVKAEAGAVRLEGPLTVTNATRALDLGGTVDATMVGTQAAPVRLSANRVGIVVGATAKLALTGEGAMGGVTVEGTTAGAGVLVLAGDLTGAVRLEGLLVKDNKAGSLADGVGGVEVRQGRSVVIKNVVFEGNQRGLTLNGEGNSDLTSFTNVVLEGNRFTLTAPGQGSAICGSKLGSQTELKLGPGNVFPAAMTTCPPAQVSNCNTGADVGHDTANAFAVTCTGG